MWQDEWPTEPGLWWFYGYLYEKNRDKPELTVVNVRSAGAEDRRFLVYIVNGAFLYKNDTQAQTKGKWLKVTLPELPNIEE